ncbi:MAG: glycosyltransferase family 2 protein [Bacillota bacterium]
MICTFNDSDYLVHAIQSVLVQSCSDWELIIIDDGSTDKTTQLLTSYNRHPFIRIVSLPINKGKANALNEALKIVKGTWMIELDADDWLASECLGLIKNVVVQVVLDVSFIYGNYGEWRERTRDKKLFFSHEYRGMDDFNITTYLENPIPLAPRIYRVEALKQTGGWVLNDKHSGRLFEDVYIITQLSKMYKMLHIDKTIYHRRLRKNSISHTSRKVFEEWLEWLKGELKL